MPFPLNRPVMGLMEEDPRMNFPALMGGMAGGVQPPLPGGAGPDIMNPALGLAGINLAALAGVANPAPVPRPTPPMDRMTDAQAQGYPFPNVPETPIQQALGGMTPVSDLPVASPSVIAAAMQQPVSQSVPMDSARGQAIMNSPMQGEMSMEQIANFARTHGILSSPINQALTQLGSLAPQQQTLVNGRMQNNPQFSPFMSALMGSLGDQSRTSSQHAVGMANANANMLNAQANMRTAENNQGNNPANARLRSDLIALETQRNPTMPIAQVIQRVDRGMQQQGANTVGQVPQDTAATPYSGIEDVLNQVSGITQQNRTPIPIGNFLSRLDASRPGFVRQNWPAIQAYLQATHGSDAWATALARAGSRRQMDLRGARLLNPLNMTTIWRQGLSGPNEEEMGLSALAEMLGLQVQ